MGEGKLHVVAANYQGAFPRPEYIFSGSLLSLDDGAKFKKIGSQQQN